MKLKTLILLAILPACGPIHVEKKENPYSRGGDASGGSVTVTARSGGENEWAEEEAASKVGGKGKSPKKKPSKKTVSKKPSKKNPHQGPGQNPSQSPFQGVFDPDAPTLEILGVDASGSGCPEDSVALDLAPDGTAFTLLFAEMLLEADQVGQKDQLSCKVSIDLAIPSGYRFTIMSLDYRGFAELGEGDVGTLETKVGFAGKTPVKVASHLEGPYSDDYLLSEEFGVATRTWYGCDADEGRLDVSFLAKLVNGSGGPSVLTVDSLDGELKQTFALVWKPCKN